MDALSPCFSSSTTVCTEPWPRHIAQCTAYRGEAEEAGLESLRSVTPLMGTCHAWQTDATSQEQRNEILFRCPQQTARQ